MTPKTKLSAPLTGRVATINTKQNKLIFIHKLLNLFETDKGKAEIRWFYENIVPGAMSWTKTSDPYLFHRFVSIMYKLQNAIITLAFESDYKQKHQNTKNVWFVTSNYSYSWLNGIEIDRNQESLTDINLLSLVSHSGTNDSKINFAKFISDNVFKTRAFDDIYIRGVTTATEADGIVSLCKEMIDRTWANGDVLIQDRQMSLYHPFCPKIIIVSLRPMNISTSFYRSGTVIDFDSFSSSSETCNLILKLFLPLKESVELLEGFAYTPTFLEQTVALSTNLSKKAVKLLLESSLIQSTPGIKTIDDPPTVDKIGGFNYIKGWAEFIKKYINSSHYDRKARPRGMIIVGPPGTGKTMVSKAMSSILGLPCVSLDVSQLMGGVLGQTEANLKAALTTIKSIGNCILLLDEIEKQMGGSTSSNVSDGGALMRVVNSFLQFMEDDTHGAIVVMTANSIKDIHPAMLRTGRIDKVFFADVPELEQRSDIISLLGKEYGVILTKEEVRIIAGKTNNFSGSELSNAFSTLAMYNKIYKEKTPENELAKKLIDILSDIRPAALSMNSENAKDLEAMRSWAKESAIDVHSEFKLF